MRVLNITNGDGAAGILKASTVPGDVLPWRDPMHHGPFPTGLSLDELRPIRSRYLAGADGDARAIERDFRLRDDHLRAASQYDRVIFWFEHDLLDQLQILQLLDWFATQTPPMTDLQIICIDKFAGIERFRGIGQLDPQQMASLLGQRTPVSDEMLEVARSGWAAFRSSDPTDLFEFAQSDPSCLPFLSAALMRHLQEFPSTLDGLSRSERQVLSLVAQGVAGPVDLFLRNMDLEEVLFLGDWCTFSVIDRLCRAGFLLPETGAFWYPLGVPDDRRAFRDQRLSLTDLGRSVINEGEDATASIVRDEWLGGVHIQSGEPFWRWDPEGGKPAFWTG